MRLLLLLLLPLLARAAAPPHPYADPVRRRIATAQDERNTAALLPFLVNKNPVYRAAATLAFGSVQDTSAEVVSALLQMLMDKSVVVRRAAAFALGQTGDKATAEVLSQRLTQATDYQEKKALAEALGCCATATTLPLLWQHRPAPDTSSAVAWGLYRASLRGLATAEAVGRATKLLDADGASVATRRGAAAALSRVRGQDSTLARVARPVLLKRLAGDADYYVRVCCATVLGRIKQAAVRMELLRVAEKDTDFRVRIAALRALPPTGPGRDYPAVSAVARKTLQSSLSQEATAAADWYLLIPSDSIRGPFQINTNALSYLLQVPHWRARATMLQYGFRIALLAQDGAIRSAIADTIRRRYERSPNPYEKAALLTALSEDPAQFDFLARQAQELQPPLVVPGAALAALVALREGKRWPAARQGDFTAVLRRALAGGDVGQLSTAAEAYANPALVPAATPDDLAALRAAQGKLTLPRDVEAWIGLQAALDKLTHASQPTPAPKGTAGQHPIDWALVQQIPVGQRVRITTTKGTVELELKVEEAPGSVACFVQLVRQHFYDGLYFHRVVPDFVAQGGDPRGDGSGSTPYTLRSEFSALTYGAGAVGLASAGKDTESCQFFFTHLPTPHLDGRYTIFAQVVAGLDVVQQLEVGDRMLRVELR